MVIKSVKSIKSENIYNITDFPISDNNRQCLTKCYTKGVNYIHPILFDIIRDHDNDTCATNVFLDKNNNPKSFDNCHINSNENVKEDNNNEYLYTIIPQINLDSKEFLANIYDLYSFDHVIDWTNQNNYLPYDTIKRVHNLAWKGFIKSPNDLNNILLGYYYDLVKFVWIKDYYKLLNKHYKISLVNGEVVFSVRNDNLDKVDNSDNLDKVYIKILKEYFPFSFFVSVIKKYVKDNNKKLSENSYDQIKKYCYKYLLKQIQKSIV
jgi:hypothetical protein